MIAVEQESLCRNGSRKLADRFGARCRNAYRELGVRYLMRRRKSIGEALDLKRNKMTELRSKPSGESGRARDAHLLAKNRANTEFEAVPGAADAQARSCLHQAREQRVASEAGVDGQRIGVQIEHAPYAGHHLQQSRRSGKVYPQHQGVRGLRAHLEPAWLTIQHKSSAVEIAAHVFHTRDRAFGEKVEQRVIVVRRPKAELQSTGTGIRSAFIPTPQFTRASALGGSKGCIEAPNTAIARRDGDGSQR